MRPCMVRTPTARVRRYDRPMFAQRAPCPALAPFVRSIWISPGQTPRSPAAQDRGTRRDPGESTDAGPWSREHLLPTGEMHLAIRLSEPPLRVFADARDRVGRTLAHALVNGMRSAHYIRDISTPALTIGAQLRPGAAGVLFGVDAKELAGRHTALEDLWGAQAADLRERLIAAGDAQARLALFESALFARLRRLHGLHPAVAAALVHFGASDCVSDAVRASGYSHRRFATLFEHAVGLSPKRWCRVQRFRQVLADLSHDPSRAWSDLAIDAGFSDQSHFNREFRAFAGMTPETWRRSAPRSAHHVAILDR